LVFDRKKLGHNHTQNFVMVRTTLKKFFLWKRRLSLLAHDPIILARWQKVVPQNI